MIFLSVETVDGIHAQMIELFGGSPGLRDRGLLESAVARAENKAYYDPEASVAEVAASLSFGLIKNHAFIDGNKRAGLGALVVFLELNGFQVACSQDEQVDVVEKVAANQLSDEQFTVWVMRVAAPVG